MAMARSILQFVAVAGTVLSMAVPTTMAHGKDLVADPASLVDPFVGTTGTITGPGNTFPGAEAPFGMIQWSPDTSSRPDGGGYAYGDSSTTGFSLTHVSGPGCAAAGDIPVLPTIGAIGTDPGSATASYSHQNESTSPGYYRLGLDSSITTELATTTRAGIGRFTYPATTSANLIIKVDDSPTPVSATTVNVLGANEITGSVTSDGFCAATNPFTLYFAVAFDHPFTANGTYGASTAGPGGEYVTFDTTADQVVQARVGISYVSVNDATANVEQEIPSWDFDATRSSTYSAWNAQLSRVRIAGGTTDQQHEFYTALYHSLLYPNVFSDVNGRYLGFDGAVHNAAAGHEQYADFSGWDTYRSQAQLVALVAPQRASDMARSAINDYQQGGTLPKWSMNNAETYIMVGDPGIALLADYYAFGARDFDTGTALAAMLHDASAVTNVRPGGAYLDSFGYLPENSSYGCCDYYATATTQLEYDTADFALSAFAGALGDAGDQTRYRDRAQDWRNIFNPASGYLQPRNSDGTWTAGFAPEPINVSDAFAEGDSLIYTGMIPFNLAGLSAKMGGNASLTHYLDTVLSGYGGLLGLAALHADLGNEPSIELPWEYDYVGEPYQTQRDVRQIQDQLWTNQPDGLPGNDDLGELSSWFVFSALGMYPETPGTADLALGSPLFTQAVLTLGDGNAITINAPQARDDTPYVQSMTVDGHAWLTASLPPSVITNGATIDYTLGASPNTSWASGPGDAPPSYDGIATPFPAEPVGPITSSVAGACVDDANASPFNGTPIQVYACNGTNAQSWTLAPDQTVQALGGCVDVVGGGTTSGTRVQLYTCKGTGAQQWLNRNGEIVNPASGLCLTDPGGTATNGTQLDLEQCVGGAGQVWALPHI
jgi:predicted alpha-1,2-mannosidase